MARKSAVVLAVVLSFFALTARAASAQETRAAQLAVNKIIASVPENSKESGVRPSPELLEAEIKAQQLEINELRERLKKLEAMLEVVTANQPGRPGVTPTTELTGAVAKTEIATGTGAIPRSSRTSGGLISMASNPASPNPRPSPVGPQRTARELLPDIGQIGAEIGLLIGFGQNPFKADEGFLGGGYIDLPLKKVGGGKISYEIMVGAQRATTETQTTSGVIALVNSALNSALGSPPSVNNLFSPLPVTNKVEERMTVLTVVPASFKYTVTALDRYNVRPYGVVGLGTYVTLTTQNTIDFDANRFVRIPAVANLLNALLQGPQVAGLAPIAPELRARGLAQGQGDFRFGLNVGGGVEFRLSPKFSLGFDYRFNRIEGINSTFSTFAVKPAIHF